MARDRFRCAACGLVARSKSSLDNHLVTSAKCRARQAGSTKDLVCLACSTALRPTSFGNLWQLVKHFETGKCRHINQREFWRLVQKLLIHDRMEHPENTSRPCITFCTNDLYILPDQHQASINSNKLHDRPCEDWSRMRAQEPDPLAHLRNIEVLKGYSTKTLWNISISKGISPQDFGLPDDHDPRPIPTIETAADVWADSAPIDHKRKRPSPWSSSPSEAPAQPARKPAMPAKLVDTDYLPEGTWDEFRLEHHLDSAANRYRCGRANCGTYFSEPDAFRAHYASYHAPYDQYKCPGNHGPLRKPTLWQLVAHVETNNDKANCGARYRAWYPKWVATVTAGFAGVAPRTSAANEPVYVSRDPRGMVLHKPAKVFRRADSKENEKW